MKGKGMDKEEYELILQTIEYLSKYKESLNEKFHKFYTQPNLCAEQAKINFNKRIMANEARERMIVHAYDFQDTNLSNSDVDFNQTLKLRIVAVKYTQAQPTFKTIDVKQNGNTNHGDQAVQVLHSQRLASINYLFLAEELDITASRLNDCLKADSRFTSYNDGVDWGLKDRSYLADFAQRKPRYNNINDNSAFHY